METIVSVYEAKAHLSKLIAEVMKSGTSVTICRNNKPVVDLVPHVVNPEPLRQDPALQGALFHGDPCNLVDAADWPEELR